MRLTIKRRQAPEERKARRQALRRRTMELLRLYLDDFLFISGGICLITAAALRWGEAAAFASAGVELIICSLLVARGGKE